MSEPVPLAPAEVLLPHSSTFIRFALLIAYLLSLSRNAISDINPITTGQ